MADVDLSRVNDRRPTPAGQGRPAATHAAIQVTSDAQLGIGEGLLARAHLVVERVLQVVLLVAPDGCPVGQRDRVRFGPQVPLVSGSAAELERNEVILLVMPRVLVCVSILDDLDELERRRIGRRRSDARRPARLADGRVEIVLCRGGVDRTRRQIVPWKPDGSPRGGRCRCRSPAVGMATPPDEYQPRLTARTPMASRTATIAIPVRRVVTRPRRRLLHRERRVHGAGAITECAHDGDRHRALVGVAADRPFPGHDT